MAAENDSRQDKEGHSKLIFIVNTLIRICIVAGCVLLFMVIRRYEMYTFTSAYAYIISTGVIIIPVIMAALLIKPSCVSRNRSTLLITILFMYEVFAYSIVFIPYIGYYYYYARYVIIHMPVIIILGMYILNYIFDRGILRNAGIRNIFAVVCIILICAGYKPYDTIIAKQQDQTAISWETLAEVMDELKEGDAVVMSQEWSLTLKIPVKLLTGADVYPVSNDNDKMQIDNLRLTHNNVYLMTEKKEAVAANIYGSDMKLVYVLDNEVKYGKVMDTDITEVDRFVPFAKKVEKTSRPLYLYKSGN